MVSKNSTNKKHSEPICPSLAPTLPEAVLGAVHIQLRQHTIDGYHRWFIPFLVLEPQFHSGTLVGPSGLYGASNRQRALAPHIDQREGLLLQGHPQEGTPKFIKILETTMWTSVFVADMLGLAVPRAQPRAHLWCDHGGACGSSCPGRDQDSPKSS